MQPSQEGRHFHRTGYFANPDVHAGFQFIKVTLHTKARLFHEVRGEETVDSGYYPGMFLDVAVAESEFSGRDVFVRFHWGTLSSLAW